MTAEPAGEASRHTRLLPLAVGALGVVFGDIGTSPLYTLQLAGTEASGADDILGVLSLIFWGLTVVIGVKYLAFIMRADNRGEGGILALLALIPEGARRLDGITMMIVAGAALLFGDGIITPSISVLSAIEGLKLAAPQAFSVGLIVAITLAILIGLFAIQRRGTGAVGRLFGPVMVLWFVTIGVLGLIQIIGNPGVLRALSPSYGVSYFVRHGLPGFPILGVVVLCLTGGEALYADMGHFGARPIRMAWIALAMPALVLCYFGQGAHVLADPATLANPFFALVPVGIWTYALVALSTLATIIASQALITGVFSLTHQAIQLGLFPRVEIRHTSVHAEGQIYVPAINWGLAIACCLLVIGFQESSRLAAAYGIAVSGTMAITSVAFYLVTRRTWGWPRWKALPLLVLFLSFDLPFFAANLLKFVDGGYVPVLVGAAFFIVMVVWRLGRTALAGYTRSHSRPEDQFLATLDQRVAARVPGTAIFLASTSSGIPMILEHHIERIHALHERVVLLTIVFAHVPYIAAGERVEVHELEQGFVRVIAHYGYMDETDIPAALITAGPRCKLGIDLADATYYLGRETFLATAKGRLGPLSEQVFAFLARNAVSATSYFAIPSEQVIEIGTQIDL
ncbi:MAG TPA: KUP/HAK/KT family potassium transporter [Kofleriaceae bacterium]|jgi:KUP system potassium uptake protein|nr:KUP/HAK/KT family potassium transporter [Kofleriaceae bacterium]